MTNIKTITTKEGLLSLKNPWEELLENTRNPSIYLDHSWMNFWITYLGKAHKPFILTIQQGERVSDIFPLALTSSPIKKLEFIAKDESDYLALTA